jgi:hypothetical protein
MFSAIMRSCNRAAHAGHADVQDQARNLAGVVGGQELLGAVEAAHLVAVALEQPGQRVTHGFIVVDDEYGLATMRRGAGRCGHEISWGKVVCNEV